MATTEKEVFQFTDLNDRCLENIFCYCDDKTLRAVIPAVCQRFQAFFTTNLQKELTKHLLFRLFPHHFDSLLSFSERTVVNRDFVNKHFDNPRVAKYIHDFIVKEFIKNNEFLKNDYLTFESSTNPNPNPTSSSSAPAFTSPQPTPTVVPPNAFLDTAAITSSVTTNLNIRTKQVFYPEKKGVYFFNVTIVKHEQNNNFAIGIAENTFKFDYNMVGFQTDSQAVSFGYSSDGFYRSGELRTGNPDYQMAHEKWGDEKSTVGCLVDFSTNEVLFFSDGDLLNDTPYPLFLTKKEKEELNQKGNEDVFDDLESSSNNGQKESKKKKKKKYKKSKAKDKNQSGTGQKKLDDEPDLDFGLGLFDDVPAQPPVPPAASSSTTTATTSATTSDVPADASASASTDAEKKPDVAPTGEEKPEEEEKKEEEKVDEEKEEEEENENEKDAEESEEKQQDEDDPTVFEIDSSCTNDYFKPFFFVFTLCGPGEKIKLAWEMSCSFFHLYPRLLRRQDFKEGLEEVLKGDDTGQGEEKAKDGDLNEEN